MRIRLVALALIGSVSASAATIPPDLAARAGQLRSQASLQVLAWVDAQGLALARSRGPIDVAALQATVRANFGNKPPDSVGGAAPPAAPTWGVLGNLGDGDIEAIAFLVLMHAAKSAQEDLKAIMAGVKAANAGKSRQRVTDSGAQRIAPTPTPLPDRTSDLLAAARKLVERTRGARLSRIVPR
jgi:hypothetical protein